MTGSSIGYKDFLANKQTFFSSIPATLVSPTKETRADTLTETRLKAQKTTFEFLYKNHALIEQEFETLHSILQAQDHVVHAHWYYCYFCCVMLHTFYGKYEKPDKVKEYASYINQTHRTIIDGSILKKNKQKKLIDKIYEDLNRLASTPAHASLIRDLLGTLSLYRVYVVFSRLSIRELLVYANGLGWITDATEAISVINSLFPVLKLLSFSFFTVRFFINLGMLCKHVLFPSHDEKSLNYEARFIYELNKRWPQLLNDMVWGSVNLLTSYAEYFGFSASIAVGMSAGFLLFDVCLLLARLYFSHQAYLLKKNQYKEEWDQCIQNRERANTQEDIEKYQQQLDILHAQRSQHEINWQVISSNYLFNTAAATLLMGGFALTLLSSTPIAIPVGYYCCAIAAAMYLSDKAYSHYKKQSFILQDYQDTHQQKPLPEDMTKLHKDERNAFILNMIKYTSMPLFIVTVFALYWPAAIALTALFILFECSAGIGSTSALTQTP